MKKIISILLIICSVYYTDIKAQEKINLQQAIDIAVKNNPGINAAKSKVKIADAKSMQAKSTFYPQASILSKYFYTNNVPGMFYLEGVDLPVMNNGTPTGDNVTLHPMAPYPVLNRDVFTFDLNLVYPIYAGNKRKNAVASTGALHQVCSTKVEDSKTDLVLKVKTVFYNYLTLNEVIKVYEDALNQLNQHLVLAQKAYEVGMRSEFDVLNFKSKIAGFKSKLVDLKGKRNVVTTALKSLLALPENKNIQFVGSVSDTYNQVAVNKIVNLNEIDNNNQKLKSLKEMKTLLDKKEKIEAAGNLPTLFAFGNYHVYHGKDFPPFDVTWRNGFAVGVGLKINLFDGNKTKGKVQEVKATSLMIDDYNDGLHLKLRTDYEKIIDNITSLRAKMKAEQENLALGKKAYQIAQTGYKNGVITNIELNDAQLNLTKIETSILNIKKELLIQYAQLDFLNGQSN